MGIKLKRTLKRTVKRALRNRTLVLTTVLLLASLGIISYSMMHDDKRNSVDPTTYAKLLQLIGHAESNNNYNAYFGNADNTTIKFTEMTIAEVLAWQANYVRQGNASSAVGRYQIVNTTLSGLVRRLGIDTKQRFDRATQDKLAIALLERRGSEKYVNQELTREQFAANLAMEWAALPKVIGERPGESYYAGDGLNQSRVKIEEILHAIEPIAAK